MPTIIASIIPSLLELIGRVVPDPKAKEAAQIEVLKMAQAGDLASLNGAIAAVLAEANGNFLQRSWRPLMMLFFAGLIGARWFGYTPPNMSENEILELWGIVKLGLGGYTIGRTAEKITPSIVGALKK